MASLLPFHSCWQTSLIVFCVLPPAAFLDCRQGSKELQGLFPPSQGPRNNRFTTKSLQGPRRKALPDLEVSSIPPSGSLLQLLYRKTGQQSKSRLCETGCLVHGEGNGKMKTHPMSCCTWSSVLCRCLQEGGKERCKIIWRPPTMFACDPFSKDAVAGLGALKSFPFLVLVTSCFC